MKIKLLSDLHLEFAVKLQEMEYFPYDGEDVLVLAGDIDSGYNNVIRIVEKFHKEGYPHIVYVAGNHEYYGTSGIDGFNADMRRYSEEHQDWFHFLDKDWCAIGDSIFIGATLWSNFRGNPMSEAAAQRGINDFRRIPQFSTKECANRHENDANYIKQAISTLPELFNSHKFYVVTHFLPAWECVDPYFKANGGLLNDYFANGMDEYLASINRDITWCYGHTHSPGVQQIGNVKLIANPYGYHGYETQAAFNPKCYI